MRIISRLGSKSYHINSTNLSSNFNGSQSKHPIDNEYEDSVNEDPEL